MRTPCRRRSRTAGRTPNRRPTRPSARTVAGRATRCGVRCTTARATGAGSSSTAPRGPRRRATRWRCRWGCMPSPTTRASSSDSHPWKTRCRPNRPPRPRYRCRWNRWRWVFRLW